MARLGLLLIGASLLSSATGCLYTKGQVERTFRVQVLEWNAFYLLVMLTLGFTYLRNGHVRVDIFRTSLSPRAKAWAEIGGFAFALLPFWVVLTVYGGEFAWIAYRDDERWLFGLGLWIKKAMLPFGVSLLFLAGILVVWRNVLFLLGRLPTPWVRWVA